MQDHEYQQFNDSYWVNSPTDSLDEHHAKADALNQNSSLNQESPTQFNLTERNCSTPLADERLRARKIKRKRTSNRYNPIKNTLSNHLIDQSNDEQDRSTSDYDFENILREYKRKNKEKLEVIKKRKDDMKIVKEIKEKIKNNEITIDGLSELDKQLIKRKKKNAKRFEDLNSKLYVCIEENVIRHYFDTTIESIRKSDSPPYAPPSLRELYERIFLYLYEKGFVTYKAASSQVGFLFAVLVTIYEDLHNREYGGYFHYKEKFLKDMQNIRATLRGLGCI